MKANDAFRTSLGRSLVAAFLIAVVETGGCKPGSPHLTADERLIRQSDDPTEWPFSVPEGVLRCAGNPKSLGLSAVTFTANGTTYGINGGALSGDVYPSVDPITPRNSTGLYKGNYGKYLDEGLEICEKLHPTHTASAISASSSNAAMRVEPVTPAKALPSEPSLAFTAKLEKDGVVKFTVTTNLPTPVAAMVSLDLHDQKDQDTAIGTSQKVTLTGPTTIFSIKLVNDVDGLDGKALPKGTYDADLLVGPKWQENKNIQALSKNLEAKGMIELRSGPSRAGSERRNNLQAWVIENVPMDAPWNEEKFKAKLGSYQKSVSTRSPVLDAYYFPAADMTLIVSRVSDVVIIWRAGRATQ